LCAIIFGGIALSQPGSAGGFMPFVATGLVVGFFGVIMIWAAFRCPRPRYVTEWARQRPK
jgi:hypothetical protein